MIDLDAVHLALRARALGLVIATTGPVDLAVTATGFTRQVGSFIDDRFRRGMEVTSSGTFGVPGNIMHGVITSVSPTEMRVSPFVINIVGGVQQVTRPALTIEAIGPGRVLTAELPTMRSWENEVPMGLSAFTPVSGIPYIEEEFSPSTSRTFTIPVRRSEIEDDGEYVIKWHSIAGVGSSGLRISVDALKELYAPGMVFIAGTDKVWIDSNPAPTTGGIIRPVTSGPVLILTIPWLVRSRNSVPA